MKQPTIAEVLHYAADHVLAPADKDEHGSEYQWQHDDGKTDLEKYLCTAVTTAVYEMLYQGLIDEACLGGDDLEDGLLEALTTGLVNMGLDIGNGFRDLEDRDMARRIWGYATEQSQTARYLFLKLAALLAEEQGV